MLRELPAVYFYFPRIINLASVEPLDMLCQTKHAVPDVCGWKGVGCHP